MKVMSQDVDALHFGKSQTQPTTDQPGEGLESPDHLFSLPQKPACFLPAFLTLALTELPSPGLRGAGEREKGASGGRAHPCRNLQGKRQRLVGRGRRSLWVTQGKRPVLQPDPREHISLCWVRVPVSKAGGKARVPEGTALSLNHPCRNTGLLAAPSPLPQLPIKATFGRVTRHRNK